MKFNLLKGDIKFSIKNMTTFRFILTAKLSTNNSIFMTIIAIISISKSILKRRIILMNQSLISMKGKLTKLGRNILKSLILKLQNRRSLTFLKVAKKKLGNGSLYQRKNLWNQRLKVVKFSNINKKSYCFMSNCVS